MFLIVAMRHRAQQTEILLVVGDAKRCSRFPVGRSVYGDVVIRRVGQTLNDAPDVLVHLESFEHGRLAACSHSQSP